MRYPAGNFFTRGFYESGGLTADLRSDNDVETQLTFLSYGPTSLELLQSEIDEKASSDDTAHKTGE